MKKIKFLSRLISIRTHFRTRMLAGFLIIIPLVLTYAILNSITSFLADTLEPGIKQAQGGPITWLSYVPITIIALVFSGILLYLAGLIAETVIGRRVVSFGQSFPSEQPRGVPGVPKRRGFSNGISNWSVQRGRRNRTSHYLYPHNPKPDLRILSNRPKR